LNDRDGTFREDDVRQDVQNHHNEGIQDRMKYRVGSTGREIVR
jgi:hypothetical protein